MSVNFKPLGPFKMILIGSIVRSEQVFRHLFNIKTFSRCKKPQIFFFVFFEGLFQCQQKQVDIVRQLLFTTLMSTKENTLERADFTLQLSMFVTAEKERRMFIIFFLSIFCQLLSPRF